MDDSIEIHAPDDTLQFPSKRSSSDGSSKTKQTKTKATSSGSSEPKSVVSTVEWPSSHGWTAVGRGVRTVSEDTARGRALPPKLVGRFQLQEMCRVRQCLQGVDPCHQLHLGHLQTASHRPVIMREDERAPIGRVIPTPSDGMCSCLPKSSSLLRREPSLWSLRRPAGSCWISPRSSSPGTSDGRPGRRRAG